MKNIGSLSPICRLFGYLRRTANLSEFGCSTENKLGDLLILNGKRELILSFLISTADTAFES
jgi:hypothetical protein